MNDIQRPGFYPGANTARTILGIASTFPGFKQSKPWQQYQDVYEVALKLTRSMPPELVDLTLNASRAEAAIREHSLKLAEHRNLIEAAEHAAQYASRSLGVEAARAAADVLTRMQAAFADAHARFVANLDAPKALTGYESEEAIATYTARQRAASDMEYLMSFRIQLGEAVGEFSTRTDAGIWTCLEAPGEDADLQQWHNVVLALADVLTLPPVARFRIFVNRGMTLSIANLNGVELRRDAWQLARNKAQGQAQLTTLGEFQRRRELGLPTPQLETTPA